MAYTCTCITVIVCRVFVALHSVGAEPDTKWETIIIGVFLSLNLVFQSFKLTLNREKQQLEMKLNNRVSRDRKKFHKVIWDQQCFLLDKWLLTLQVPIVTNINFLLMISIDCQEIRLWEYIKRSQRQKSLIFYQILSTNS